MSRAPLRIVFPLALSFRSALVIAVAAILTGCASAGAPLGSYHDNKYSVPDIVAMVKAGEPTDQIIDKLAKANGFYPLTASALVKLHDQGVPTEILDYMQASYLRVVRNEERYQLPQRFNSTY